MKLKTKKILFSASTVFVLLGSATVSYQFSLPHETTPKVETRHRVTMIPSDVSIEKKSLLDKLDLQPFSPASISEHLQIMKSETAAVTAQNEARKKEKKKKLTKIEKYKNQISRMGVTDLTKTDEEALKIHTKANKKSKVTGYLADGAVMTIEKKTGKWYQIKSGDISGYVSTQYVIKNKKVETSMMEDKNISAVITKQSVPVRGETKKNSAVVGMSYKDGEYPILDLSNNDKYALIERTETISGWVPVSDINIKITAPKAMTKEEFEDYQDELAMEEQAALNSYLNLKISSTGNPLQDKIVELIAHNESGNYKAARNPITSGEKTITVGAWQWYGGNAHNILRLICAANTDKAKDIIHDSMKGKKAEEKATQLYKDIMGGDNWEGSRRIFTTQELIAIKELLGSNQGVQVQNSKIQADIRSKISVAIGTYKLTNDSLTAYFCDMFWQNPQSARAITNECIKHFGSAKKFCEAEDGLKYLHKTALKNGVLGKYSRRRNYTYLYCKNL
ncbi:MAG: SH3 domain-containing protein [Eubacterium sp.]|nr:SH3 domain-containing protein [Eubacterium sp.]